MKKLFIGLTLIISSSSFAASWECTALCTYQDKGRVYLLETENRDNDAMVSVSRETPASAISEMQSECKKRLAKRSERARFSIGEHAYPVVSMGKDYKSSSNFTSIEYATVKNACVKL